MSNELSLVVSALALVISIVTAWLTFFRRGELKMTMPTTVFFGPDGGSGDREQPRNKVYLRTLLYSTSKRGQLVESIHVTLQRGETRQNFSVWVYGDRGPNLARGSGLFVGEDGVTHNHHFLLPKDGANYEFLAGAYAVRVFAKRVRDRAPVLLHELRLRLSESDANQMRNLQAGVYFDWGPDQQAYHPHIDV